MLRIITVAIFLMMLLIMKDANTQDTCACKRKWVKPRFIATQYAGGIGNYVFGAGYNLNSPGTLQLALMYGWTPKYKANATIHTLSLKFSGTPFRIWIKQHYLAATGSFGISHVFADGDKTFIRLPEIYPEDYYAPSALRFHLNLGGKFKYNISKDWFVRAIEVFLETTTNDLYLKYYYSYQAIKLNQIFTMDFGVNVYIR